MKFTLKTRANNLGSLEFYNLQINPLDGKDDRADIRKVQQMMKYEKKSSKQQYWNLYVAMFLIELKNLIFKIDKIIVISWNCYIYFLI